jgi:signal transduction histidine kinase
MRQRTMVNLDGNCFRSVPAVPAAGCAKGEPARSQFEKVALNREGLDVNEIIRETVVLLRAEAARYRISIRTDWQPIFRRVQLQQVTMNLILNSVDAMKDAEGIRELVIESCWGENGQVLVTVSDTGIGFPQQLAEEIFDPFFTTKPHGTGMGLRISRSIIESHGGRIWQSVPQSAERFFT